jgi:hypothetical protein
MLGCELTLTPVAGDISICTQPYILTQVIRSLSLDTNDSVTILDNYTESLEVSGTVLVRLRLPCWRWRREEASSGSGSACCPSNRTRMASRLARRIFCK